jgi:glucokinase
MALGGPKVGNTIKVTQCQHWPAIDGDEITEKYKFPRCYLLNDFEANGYGIINNSGNKLYVYKYRLL